MKEELLAVRRDLKKQQSLLKQGEQKHKKQVDRLKRQCEQQVNGMSNDESWKSIEQRTSTLEKCQSEILVLVKEQMRLIEFDRASQRRLRCGVVGAKKEEDISQSKKSRGDLDLCRYLLKVQSVTT